MVNARTEGCINFLIDRFPKMLQVRILFPAQLNLKTMSKKTAVEWLVEQIKNDQNQKSLSASEWIKVINQAKEMEREQIKSAYVAGREDWHLDKYFSKHSGDYYNQTYKP